MIRPAAGSPRAATPAIRLPGEVKVFDATTGHPLFTLRGHTSNVVAVAFNPEGNRIASASFDQTIKLWELETGQEILTLRGHKSGVMSVAFSPDGRLLATGSIDHTVRVWEGMPLDSTDRPTPTDDEGGQPNTTNETLSAGLAGEPGP